MTDIDIYRIQPIAYHDEIPVFSRQDAYIENYEQISSDHLSLMTAERDNPWISEEVWQELEESTAALIRKYAVAGNRILDVGVGLGRLLSRFPELDRFGMDISRGYLQVARSKGIQVCCSKIEDMPYRENSFDLVVCTDVLEHVVDLNAAVRNLIQVTKQGGYLIVRVPYRENLAQYLDENYPYQLAHLRTFDEFSLKILFTKLHECQYYEDNLTLHVPSLFKLKIRFPKLNKLIFLITRAIRFVIGRQFYRKLCRKLFEATEINMVFRKP